MTYVKIQYLTFRFGITHALKTKFPVKRDEELFAHYGYPHKFGPKWYRELYKEYVKENPEKADKKALKVIQELDEALAKQPIPLTTSDQSEDTLSFPSWG